MAGSCGLRDCGDPACTICAVGRLPQPEKLALKLRDGLRANAKATTKKRPQPKERVPLQRPTQR